MIFVADETHHCRSPEPNSSENETIATLTFSLENITMAEFVSV